METVTVRPNKPLNKLIHEKSLKEILDGLVVSHKQDIHSFSSGHLNEANLPKPPDKAKYISWNSSKKPSICLVPRSSISTSKKLQNAESPMKESLLHFSVGTVSNLVGPKNTPVSKPPTVLGGKTPSYAATKKSVKDDDIYMEEPQLPEYMLAKSNPTNLSSSLNSNGNGKLSALSPRSKVLPLLEHEFLPSYLQGITKKDQLQKWRQFETDVLRKQDASEQNVMSGIRAVAHLEVRLQQNLEKLKQQGYGPNFQRLQIFSDLFEDFIEDSTTFGPVLQRIKTEYDNYLASLLSRHITKHEILQGQVEQLTSQTHSSGVLHDEIGNVQSMEGEGKRLLQENERLREELRMEHFLKNKPTDKDANMKELISGRLESKQDLQEQVEELKAMILEKLDSMNSLKMKLRTEHVPSTVCSHLEQCIKETEVETQKLTTQKEFFERNISEMEKDLQQAIETADTTEKDSRRVWKRVTAVKAVDRGNLHGNISAGITTTGPGGVTTDPCRDSDDDQDEVQKWNWYIS